MRASAQPGAPVTGRHGGAWPELEAVAERLTAQGVLSLTVGAPFGDGFASLSEVAADLRHWHAAAEDTLGDRRVAAFTVAGLVVATPVLAVGLPAVLGGVAATVDLAGIALHPGAAGIDAWALAPQRVAAISDGGAALGASLATLTAPLVDAVTAALPIGAPAAWGLVADALGAYVLWFARESGDDATVLWARAAGLLDRMASHAPLRRRPRLFPVVWSGGTTHYPVRATCCLYYRLGGPDAAPRDHYCTTCPLRADDDRRRRLIDHLEGHA